MDEQKQQTSASVILGKDQTSGALVSLSAQAREFSLYALGSPGVGKSNLLESMARQDMENGDGVCFLDPHGSSSRYLCQVIPPARLADGIFWAPKDVSLQIGLNPFYCPTVADPIAVDRKVEDFLSALASLQEFQAVFQSAPQMLDVLRHLAFACILNQGTTLLHTVPFLTDVRYRRTFYPALEQYHRRDILDYWQQFDKKTPYRQEEQIRSSLNKLRRLSTTNITRTIFKWARPTFDFRALMDERKILLVDLSGLGEGNGELIGALLVSDLLRAAFSRGDVPEDQRPPFHLFADEFERFMSTAFPQILDEGRKFRLFCVLAHQHRGQLEGSSRGSTLNIKNKIIFQVNSKDAQELAWEFDTTPPPAEPKLEMITEPVYETYYEDVWDTKANEDTYITLSATHRSLLIRAELLYDVFELGNMEWSDILMSVDEARQAKKRHELQRTGKDRYQENYELRFFNEQLFKHQTKFAVLMSPAGTAPVVEQYIETRLGPTTSGRLILPPSLPSRLEQLLGQLLSLEDQKAYCDGYWPREIVPSNPIEYRTRQLQEFNKSKREFFKSLWYGSIDADCRRTVALSPPSLAEAEAAALAFLIELRALLTPLREQAGPYLCNGLNEFGSVQKVKPKLFPAVGLWLYTQLHHVWDSREQVEQERKALRQHHCTVVTQKRALGYELPVKLPKDARSGERPGTQREEELQTYRKVAGTQKKHTDVAAEIANALTNLPKFTARGKLDHNGRPVEYQLATLPPPPLPADAHERAAFITNNTRQRYGRRPAPTQEEPAILTKRKPADETHSRPLPQEGDQDQPTQTAREDNIWR